MFLLYSNGLRVVIHTSNLIERDWHQKTQGQEYIYLLNIHNVILKKINYQYYSQNALANKKSFNYLVFPHFPNTIHNIGWILL